MTDFVQGLVNLDFSAPSGNNVAPLLASASIRWMGFIRPSKSGEYTFSVLPQVLNEHKHQMMSDLLGLRVSATA